MKRNGGRKIRRATEEKKTFTQSEIQGLLDGTARKIAEIITNFSNRTGQIIGEISINNQGQWDGDKLTRLTQSVTLRCGVPEKGGLSAPPQQAIQIERPE